MAELPAMASNAHLRLLLDVVKHWVLHFVGLMPVSVYSLRKAFIEAHRLSLHGHVLQRIVASSGDIVIVSDQIARVSGDAGIPRE